MENNSWRGQGQAQIPVGQVMGGESVAAQGMETGDWRNQLQQDSRQRIVNKIMDTLKRHLPFSGQEGLLELKKIAVRFEEKIYTAATSQSDYLRKISLKMLTMETKSQNPMASSLQSNAPSNSKNPQDAGSQSIQPQMQNQVQQLPIPIISNQPQGRQPVLTQNIQNNMASSVAPSSASLTSGLAPGGLSHGTMPNVAGGQNANIQEMPGVNPNIIGGGTSMGQGGPFANSQRQIPGRQQQQEQQQQSQNTQPQQLFYNQQMQQNMIKPKFQHQGNISQSLSQSQIQQQHQQQNLIQPTQLQSAQQAAVMQQPSLRQSSASSTLQQNQQSSVPQSSQFILQQQPQSVLRPHQQQPAQHQLPMMHQQTNSVHQQQQPNTANMQQNQLIGQQNIILDQQQQQRLMAQQNNMQQQQASSQQNNLTNMHQQQQQQQQNNHPSIHQQQLGQQNNLSSFQQQMVGNQHASLGMQTNQQPGMLQQSKVAAPQQMQPNMPNLLPNQAQQSQSQPLMSQIQSQPAQLQQLGLQQTQNPLQRDMQQRMQTSGSLLPQQPMIDQHKQLMQSQRLVPEVPLTSVDSSPHTGNTNSSDWQEEIYQKIKSLKEMYYPDLNDMYQKIAVKLQQQDSLSQLPKNDQFEKLKYFQHIVEKHIMYLRTNKNDIQPSHKEKLITVEKQIANILNSHRPRKPVSTLQPGQVPQSQVHAMQQSQQPQAQISQMQSQENQMNSHMQQMSTQGSVVTMQQNGLTNLQHNSLPSQSNSRQNNMDTLQSGSNVDPGQGNGMNSTQQVSASQNSISGSQQMNMNPLSSQTGMTTLQSNVNSLQANQPLVKQEPQMFPNQHSKQHYQQRQMQQHYMHRQLIQQQHQTTPQQPGQLPSQQIGQLNQMNDSNDMKMRQQIGGKSGVLQQHQRPSYQHQQAKAPFSISSPQVLQAASPQIGHHPSPQLDQQNLLNSHPKAGTPMQSANSPFIVPSPSISMVPSPMPGDSEKITSGVSSLSNTGNNVQHHYIGSSALAQSLAIGTPGISASPLLAEFTSPDGTHGVASTIVSGSSNVVEQPLDRLLKVVKSMSQKALTASVSDISSVVSMVDRIAGSAPGNGSRAAAGEDLVAMTKCRLQARNFFTQDGPSGSKKMRRYTSAMPSNVVSSTGSVNDSLRYLNGFESDGESTGASSIKRHGLEANHALEEELREINQRLIDTVVYISEDDVDPTAVSVAAEGGEGTIVKCSFSAVALSPNLKSQYASAQMSPIQPLRLLVPNDYPNCSPILLDKFPVEISKEYEDLSIKAKSRFSISLRSLAQPMSLGDIARTWDICARAVISEYAQQSGGGSFSSKYGTWETCLSGA